MKTCIIIAGPTAAGKTAVAVEVAKAFNTEIISADSRQCYKELNIGVAKPSAAQLSDIQHHFINTISVKDNFTVAGYEQYSLQKLAEIFSTKNVAVVCGGTGLYLKALTEGLDEIPAVAEHIRIGIRNQMAENGIEKMQEILKQKDPEFAATEAINNTNRVLRAMEILESTGRALSSFKTGKKVERPFKIIACSVSPEREVLYRNINTRVDDMMAIGLLEEVKTLVPYQNLNALNTVGYKELFSYLNGESDLDHAIELIKQNTRRYAKRQITWFKNQGNYTQLAPVVDEVLEFIQSNK